jgi:hypothetical protein
MEVVFPGGRLQWRLCSLEVVFNGGRLPHFPNFGVDLQLLQRAVLISLYFTNSPGGWADGRTGCREVAGLLKNSAQLKWGWAGAELGNNIYAYN